MSLTRRGFLKILGGATVAAVVAPKLALPEAKVVVPPQAPLFVPSQNLDMGVPRRILTATEMPTTQAPPVSPLTQGQIEAMLGQSVPMLLLQSEFLPKYGGKLPAGAEVLVDQATAARWIEFGVAAPGPRAPRDLQERAAARMLGKCDQRIRAAYYGQTLEGIKSAPAFRDVRG